MRRLLVAAAAAVLATASAGMAQAGQVIWTLDQNGCGGSGCLGSNTEIGHVTVVENAGALDFTVSLDNGATFNTAGKSGQHHAFVFDADVSGLTIGGLTNGVTTEPFALPTMKSGKTVVTDPGPYSDSPFGNGWTYALNYTGTASQGSGPTALTFTLSDAANNLTLADLVSPFTNNGVPVYAAADLYSNGNTGNVGAVGGVGGVPEPATWAMLVMGVGMLGFGLRRRRAGAAPVAVA